MTPQEYARIRELFDRAMTLPLSERRRFVDENSPTGDPARDELLAMVDAGDDSTFLANAFAAGVLDQVRGGDANLPPQIGNYKILRVLGRGGMGVVYLALRNDDVFRKVVALKVIGEGLDSAEVDLVERFKQERQLLAGLDHPNIARILDGGSTSDGRPFYVMEYVAGSPIDEYCARMQTDVPTRVRMMAQACDAIEYLHNHAIAHRDIKPHNILVTMDGRVKLVDFGIAKVQTAAIAPGAGSGIEPTLIMTPGYASPEQVAGDHSGKSGDIYSVAVVLYQLLTGRLPFADQHGRPNLAAQLSGKPPQPPSEEIAKGTKAAPPPADPQTICYPDLDRAVLTALQRDPLRRYPTVQLFGEDLRRCLDGRPISAHPASWTYRLQKLVARNRVAAAVLALGVLSGGAGLWLTASARSERAALEAKETELERFVTLLNTKVAAWQDPTRAVPDAQKLADVREANRVMTSETVRTLSERAPDRPRLKRVVGDLRTVLDRADGIARDQPPVRKEIALAFRKIGDFENNAPLLQAGDRTAAARSYQRAASIAADIKPSEGSWSDEQLAELSSLLAGLGARPAAMPVQTPVSAAPERETTPQTIAASDRPAGPPVHGNTGSNTGAPPGPARTVAERVTTAAPAVDNAARIELVQRLRRTTSEAERAHQNVEAMRASLASRGQTLRSDVVSTLGVVDGLIDDARASLEANDLENAEDYLRRASAQLKKVFQAVGG